MQRDEFPANMILGNSEAYTETKSYSYSGGRGSFSTHQ